MSPYTLQRHPRFQEITVTGAVTVELFQSILSDLAQAENFVDLDAMWVFTPDARPPAFHEFDKIIATVECVYPRRPLDKRVALVVPSSFTRSVADVFRAAAARLPLTFAVFDTRAAALAWLDR